MAKVSRPVVYAVLLGIAAYVGVVLTEPESATKRKATSKSASATAKAPPGFLAEDLDARFEKPSRSGRNAFQPAVVPQNSRSAGNENGPLGGWNLTGIVVVGGETQVLLENPTSGDSTFLRKGDVWNEMTLRSIEPDAAIFVQKNGKTVRISFPEAVETQAVAPAVVAVPPAAGAPTAPLATATSSNPIPVPADDETRRGRRRNR